ncbi:MAG: hypothetical protein CVV42_14200 [Candidatus Riflebacteria bacterium HGW-Riflebacteria-2]|jgi:hypothetical protein|nr:MAG: hypothetical protein CVV42_14200 [Candidatus Riflebacteria bacterium HGW-Riflebacteria-2]
MRIYKSFAGARGILLVILAVSLSAVHAQEHVEATSKQPASAVINQNPCQHSIPYDFRKVSRELWKGKEYTGYVLAWKVKEDNRPLLVEEVIVAFERGKKWTLALVWKHPLSKESHRNKWNIFFTTRPQFGIRNYNEKPTQTQLIEFLNECRWKFEKVRDWKILNVGINQEGWKDLTGQNPPDEYIQQVELHRNSKTHEPADETSNIKQKTSP